MYDGITLGARGHYFTPNGGDAFGGSCQLADVVELVTTNGPQGTYVNLAGYQHDGEPFRRLSVQVIGDVDALEPDLTARLSEAEGASWHLQAACPFRR